MAIGVFGLLVAGAFGLAAGSIELTREVNGFETRELARMRFLQLCRATFRELPGTARFRLLQMDAPAGGGAASQLLRLSGHPRAFPVGVAKASAGEAFASIMPDLTILTTRPDGAGGRMLQLYHLAGEDALRFEEEPSMAGLKGEALNLLRGIRVMRWRFYDAKQEEWLDLWKEDNVRPRFVELTLQLNGDQRPYRSVFWVPEAQLPNDFQPLPGSPPSGNPNPELPPGSGNVPTIQVEAPGVTLQP